MQLILSNATVVLPDQLLRGCVVVQDGRIAEVQSGRSAGAGALDLEGDILIPGAVDLHTDNLERQVQPRMNARWPSRAALLAHDAQCAAAGVTTVFDALCVGDLGFDEDRGRTCADGIADLEADHVEFHAAAEHHPGRRMTDHLETHELFEKLPGFLEIVALEGSVGQRVRFDD